MEARRTCAPLLHKMGHIGIAIYFYSFDRALYEILLRLMLKFHADAIEAQQLGPADRVAAMLKTWVIGFPCGIHIGHKGLEKGLSFLRTPSWCNHV